MATPPLFSTFSAITELFVTAAVGWFFYQAWHHKSYRFGVIGAAILYETAFNIVYMVTRLGAHEGTAANPRPGWYIAFVAAHGLLSLGMFLGLIGFVIWTYMQRRAGIEHPLRRHPVFAATFLALWGVSIVTGEAIYVLNWVGAAGG